MAQISTPIKIGNFWTNLVDSSTGESVNYEEVTEWFDGTPMDDSKADGEVYRKLPASVGGGYVRKVYPDFGEIFLEKDNMLEMRALSGTEVLLIQMGRYRGIRLNGYYVKGDTPAPLEYFLTSDSGTDNGGSFIDLGAISVKHDFLGEVNVKYFGATGDSVTDDTPFLQNVIASEDEIFIPDGDYKLTEQLFIADRDGVNIRGNGPRSKIVFSQDVSTAYSIVIIRSSGCTISNLTIDGGGGGVDDQAILFSLNSPNTIIENCNIKNTGPLTNGISVSMPEVDRHNGAAIISNNIIESTGKSSIYVNCDNVVVSGNICKDVGQGTEDFTTPCIQVRSSKNVTLSGNVCDNATQAGIFLFNVDTSATDNYFKNIVISGNTVRNCRQGILIQKLLGQSGTEEYSANIVVDSNILELGLDITNGVGVTLIDVSEVGVSNNQVFGGYRYGVDTINSHHVSISHNSFGDCIANILRLGGVGESGGGNFTIQGNSSYISEGLPNTLVGIQAVSSPNITLLNNVFNGVDTNLSISPQTSVVNRIGNSFDRQITYTTGVTVPQKRNLHDLVLLGANGEVGRFSGWECYRAGLSLDASYEWTGLTTVAVGAYCQNAGNAYISLNAGARGATAPTHTSGDVSDGSITWRYVSPVALFTRRGYFGMGIAMSAGLTPPNPQIGYFFFNTSSGKPQWWNGTRWVDALGVDI